MRGPFRILQSTYPREVQQRIRGERLLAIAVHLSVVALLGWQFGAAAALRAYVLPVFFRPSMLMGV